MLPTPIQVLATFEETSSHDVALNFEKTDSYDVRLNIDKSIYGESDTIQVTFQEYSIEDYDLEQLDLSDSAIEINENIKIIEYSVSDSLTDSVYADGIVYVLVSWIDRAKYTISIQCENIGNGYIQSPEVDLIGFNSVGKKVFTSTVWQPSLVSGNSTIDKKTMTGATSIEFTPACIVNGELYIGSIGILN